MLAEDVAAFKPKGDGVLPWAEGRPKPSTRGACIYGSRPCPWLRCRYHLWPDVSKRRELPKHSCALDVADEGAHTLEQLGDLLGLTRERLRQIEALAIRKAFARAPIVMGDDVARDIQEMLQALSSGD